MKTIIITVASTLAVVFAVLVAIVAYEAQHIQKTYTCVKVQT